MGKIAREAGERAMRLPWQALRGSGHLGRDTACGLVVACFVSACVTVTASAAPEAASQAGGSGAVRRAHVLEQDRTGLDGPAGLAFSSQTGSFYVVEAKQGRQSDTEVVRLTPFARTAGSHRAGSARIAAGVRDAVNVAFDSLRSRLLLLDAADRLLEVRTSASGELDPQTLVRRDALRLDLRNPQGMSVDAATGAVYVLDADPARLVRVEASSDGSFDRATVTEIGLGPSGIASARGLAFDPSSHHLHVRSGQTLHELTTAGEPVAARDLSPVGLQSPQGLAFGPSSDRTDSPGELSLYVADAGARGSGQIVELSLALSVEPQSSHFTPTLVQRTNLGALSPPSPDSSGIGYVSTTDRLIVSDGEVEETVSGITHFQGASVWELNRDGTYVRSANVSRVDWPAGTPSPVPMTDEPTGVAHKPGNGHYFFTEDGGQRVYDLNPGTDGLVGTADDTWTNFSTAAENGDPEGIAYDSFSDRLYVADGVNREVYRYTTSGSLEGQFDTAAYGVQDPETVEFNPVSGTLFALSNNSSGPVIIETTTSGTLLQTISLAAFAPDIEKPAGLAYAPGSDGSGQMHFFLVDRGVDNNVDPNAIDGELFEFTAPTPGTPGNAPPAVGAGSYSPVTLPAAVDLDGTVTDDGLPNPPGATTKTWTQVSGPSVVTFGNASAEDTTASVSVPGTYVVRLTASDGEFSVSSEATLTFTGTAGVSFLDTAVAVSSDDAEQLLATNGMRLANADLDLMDDPGGNNNVAAGLRFTGLGIPQGATVTYAYVQFEANTPSSVPTSLTLRGQAADNAPTFVSQNSNITLRPTTSASASWSPQPWPSVGEVGLLQRTPNLAGIVNEVVNRPGWVSSNALVLVITGSGQRSAEAWDSNPAAAPRLHVEWPSAGNQPPSVSAGSDQTITLPGGASLDGTVTDDGLPNPPGAFTTEWSQQSGSGTATFGNPNAVDTTVTFSAAGTYVLRLTADDSAAAFFDELTVTVNAPASNQAPVVSAGSDQTIALPAQASLDGTVTDDGLPNPPGAVTTTWSKQSGPGTVTFGDASAVDTTAAFSIDGSYVLQLQATDGSLTTTDTVTVTVDPAAGNQPPTVSAGPDQQITSLASAVLDGTVTDDGQPPPGTVTTTWSLFTGPGTVAFGNPGAIDTTATFSAAGTYVLRLTADDGSLQAFDDVIVTANSATLAFSVGTAQTLGGVPVTPQDVVAFDGSTFSVLLDGGDVGLDSSSESIDALALLANGHVLVSTTGNFAVPGLSGNDEDVIELAPSLLGATTAGTWTMFFDGGNFGLTTSGEDVDAVELLADGHVVVSTSGAVSVTGVSGDDEDALEFAPGPNTWAMYFDGTDVGLTASAEDVDGIALGAGGAIHLSTAGNFSVTGASGADEDVVRFTPTTLGANTSGTFSMPLTFDGSAFGLGGNDLFAIELP